MEDTKEKEVAGRHEAMSAYFELENFLYGEHGKDKSIEMKSAMIWGGLSVVQKMGCISWDGMRNIYGEFMSKQMGLR